MANLTPLFQIIAREICRARRCEFSPAGDAANEALDNIEREHLPSGSGFDSGSRIDRDESRPDKIVIATGFHHMNETGYYNGWTKHHVIVTPCLKFGFSIRVTGKDKNGIKEYIADTFHAALSAHIER